jgi:hypothetical protein
MAVKTAEVDEQKTKRKHISQLYKVNTEQNINNILLINMTQSCQIKHFTCILRLLNNTCVKHFFKSVHVSNLFWSREYNSAKEICKYPSFSKVGGNYPLDLKIIWSSETWDWYRFRCASSFRNCIFRSFVIWLCFISLSL